MNLFAFLGFISLIINNFSLFVNNCPDIFLRHFDLFKHNLFLIGSIYSRYMKI
eukprot:TRINITY_DN6701_c0_g1_i1.p2 TRINITY_DN6701_c0_g1~~TRINITY_DN6701_c0_g1_i1.p2  ORF type:complete len:53 (+),score=7.44 TRINITY_DN6701_c0_g1_i1:52-210(+)